MWGLLKVAVHREQYLFGSFKLTSVSGDVMDTGGCGSSVLPSWVDLLTVSLAGKVIVCLSTSAVRHISV